MIWTLGKKTGVFVFFTSPKVGPENRLKTFFFGDHLISAKKNVPNLVKTFFFGDHLILTEKPS